MEDNAQGKLLSQTNGSLRWTAVTEIAAKIIAPVMNMVLAHLVAPEVFGIVASISIIVTFAQMFAESGFAKYLVQHNFNDDATYKKFAGVALSSTLIVSLVIFVLIVVFRNPLASLVNCDGYGLELAIAAIQIPLYGLSSIQIATARRDFCFKRLGIIRISATLLQAGLSISLALLGFPIFSLVIGPIVSIACQCLFLFIFSKTRFGLTFNFSTFKEMLSFSILFFIETLCSWVNSSIDIFFIGYFFNTADTGIYKNAFSTEKGIMLLITSIFAPVLFSLLSRLQDDDAALQKAVFKYQKAIAYIVIPMGVGLFIYQDFATWIFFGNGWGKAAIVLGAFGLSDCFKIPISDIASTVAYSKGKPQYSIYVQLFYIASIVACCFIFGPLGFEQFVIARAACVGVLVVGSLIFLSCAFHISAKKILLNLLNPLFISGEMFALALGLQSLSHTAIQQFLSIFFCIIFYFSSLPIMNKADFVALVEILINKPISDPDHVWVSLFHKRSLMRDKTSNQTENKQENR